MRLITIFLLLSILFIGCTSSKTSKGIYLEGIYKNKELKYKIGTPPKDWKRLKVKGLNLVFFNKKDSAIIYVNGKCGKSSDAPLKVLKTHLLIGFKNKKFEKTEKLKIENRLALHSILTAEMDGVKRKIDYYILKKNGCLYDMVLITPPKKFEKNRVIFRKLLKNFKIIKGSNIKVFIP